ncbi:sugar phosphate isomerase/epimerase family protein [Raineyella sp. LH-20]|uniref:sugar phosphate isomerase/epimerase family protein n=1 Tax=Raineyella sp. LH-20 TaxID=3081204 RepID=UPI002952A69C|nr:sugar phosphate isomerase/epimerase family protein [Raineyella sp. LH-20]WOP19632.1 sugar phosphate isomerase/epimerase family protein [Raineyella sp. LH-20]
MSTILGHTLGTPDRTLEQALDLFRDAGADGAEIIWQDGYSSALPEPRGAVDLTAVGRMADERGLVIGALTPYVTGINSLDEDERRHDVQRLSWCIDDAAALGCPRIRVYAGAFSTEQHRANADAMWDRLVESLGELGQYAAQRGVTLCVENHFSTMTVSAKQSVRLMQAVSHPAVGILYDQANLTFTHDEEYREAIALQAPWIKHVHVKDLEFIDPNRRLSTPTVSHIQDEDRVHRSRMIGEGVLDWTAVLTALVATGYDGSYSLEYEYRWNPQDLPEPAVGFAESTRRLQAALGAAGARRVDPAVR